MDRKKSLILSAGGARPQVLCETTYDVTHNNVISQKNQLFSPHFSLSDIGRKDIYTYGYHGNVLTHTVDGVAGQETTTYFAGSQYFQKASVTDMDGHTTNFEVGS